jgi:hypothetical protein
MQALARFERLESRNRRASPRRRLSLGASLPQTGEQAVIHDLSTTGILIETNAELATFEQLHIDLPEVGPAVATVMWNSGQYFGCEFHERIPQAAISAAMLRNPIGGRPAEALGVPDPVEETEVEYDHYPLTVRMRVILGSSILLWALILWAVGIL